MLLGVVDQLGHGIGGEAGVGHHQQGAARHLHDGRDVRDRIERHPVKAGVDRVAGGNQRQGVAVRGCVAACLDADHAARTGPVFHHDGLLQVRRQGLAQISRQQVCAAARHERHDQADGALGIVGMRHPAGRGQHTSANCGKPSKIGAAHESLRYEYCSMERFCLFCVIAVQYVFRMSVILFWNYRIWRSHSHFPISDVPRHGFEVDAHVSCAC
ncbi:hypothetical protein D3C86_711750 [compost metagenome]